MNEFGEKRFIKDDIIVNLDEKGEIIYLVLLGKCQLEVLVDLEKTVKNENLQEFIVKVCELGSKEIFGEEILVNSTQTYQYIVKCSTVETIVLTITQALFEAKFPRIVKETINKNFLIKQNQRAQFIQTCKEKYTFETEEKVIIDSNLSIPKKNTKLQTLFNRFEEIHNLKISRNDIKNEKMPLKLYEDDNETEEYFSRFTYESKTKKAFSPSPIKKQQQAKIVTQINKRYNLEKLKTANDQIFKHSSKILLTQTALDKIQSKSKGEEICRAITTQPKQKRFTNCFEYINNKFLQEKIDECMLQKKKQQSMNITDQKSLQELKFNFGNTMDFPIERLIAANLIKKGVIKVSSQKKNFLAEINNAEKNQKISRSMLLRIQSAQMTQSQFSTPSPVKPQPQQIDYNLTMTEKFMKTQRSRSANLPFQTTSTSRYNNQLKTNNFFRKFVLYKRKHIKTNHENYDESQEQFYQIGSQQKNESCQKCTQKSESCPKLFNQKKPTTSNNIFKL